VTPVTYFKSFQLPADADFQVVAGRPELVRELHDHGQRVSAPYKYPREIEFVAEAPKAISGKIRRVECREREAGQA
jgi:acyl-coenzyme A synthetase/AMP-(fatty) acid ligase